MPVRGGWAGRPADGPRRPVWGSGWGAGSLGKVHDLGGVWVDIDRPCHDRQGALLAAARVVTALTAETTRRQ